MTLDEAVDIVLHHHDSELYAAAAMQIAGESIRLQLELANLRALLTIPEANRAKSVYRSAYAEATYIVRGVIKGHQSARMPVGIDSLEELAKSFAQIAEVNPRTLKPLRGDKK